MALKKKRTLREEKPERDETLFGAFWRGFFWPGRLVGKCLAWLSHRPPLKQIGHFFRWFFGLKPLRFLAKILGIRYVVRSAKELKQVTWPTLRDSIRLTFAVLVFSIVFGLIVTVIDFGLDGIFRKLFID